MRPNSPGILFAAGLSAFSSSCLFHKSPVVFTPPAPVSQPSVPSAPPPQLAPPPRIAGDPSASVPPEVAISIPELAAPPEPPKPQPKKSASTPPPKPVTPVTPEQPSQPPRLGQIFTPEEEREYNRTIDESLNRVKRALGALSRKSLNPDQAKDATRIAEFQKQAEDARDAHDLANADLWAKRAATLADDLLNRVP